MLATIEIQLNDRVAFSDVNALVRLLEAVYAAAESVEGPEVERTPVCTEYVGFGRSALRMRGAPKATGMLAAFTAQVLVPLLSAAAGGATTTVVEYYLSGNAKATQAEVKATCPQVEPLIYELGDASGRALKPNGNVTYSLTLAEGAEELSGLTTKDILAVESALKERDVTAHAIGEMLYVLARAAAQQSKTVSGSSNRLPGLEGAHYRGVESPAATVPNELAAPDVAHSSDRSKASLEGIQRRFCADYIIREFLDGDGRASEIPELMSLDPRTRAELLSRIRSLVPQAFA